MRKGVGILAVLLLITLAASGLAQPLADPLIERLVGTWVLRGTIGGQATTHDVTAEWALGRQYVRLHEVSREQEADGRPAYEALVFIGWNQPPGEYACLWLDSTGGSGLVAQSIGHAPRAADALAFLFTMPDGSRFHTTFAYDRGSDSWQWLMDGEERGKLTPFARVKLTRE